MNADELTLYFSDVDGVRGRAALVFFTGLPAAVSLWLLFLCVNQLRIMGGVAPSEFDELQLVTEPSSPWEVIGSGMALLSAVLLFGFPAARFAALGWRSVRGRWWLRLSAVGFEVNDRVCRPRRYRWSDIDGFLLVHADGETSRFIGVGFRFVPEKRRRRRRPADHNVMGWWDRPFDQAVDLMNGWLARHRGRVTADQR